MQLQAPTATRWSGRYLNLRAYNQICRVGSSCGLSQIRTGCQDGGRIYSPERLPINPVMSSAQRSAGPHRSGLRVILIVSISFIIAVSAIALIAFGSYWLGRTTVGDVEAMIDENLPPGSSADEILAFLDSRDIDHGAVRRVGDYSVY